jgi:hypothetical protein
MQMFVAAGVGISKSRISVAPISLTFGVKTLSSGCKEAE